MKGNHCTNQQSDLLFALHREIVSTVHEIYELRDLCATERDQTEAAKAQKAKAQKASA